MKKYTKMISTALSTVLVISALMIPPNTVSAQQSQSDLPAYTSSETSLVSELGNLEGSTETMVYDEILAEVATEEASEVALDAVNVFKASSMDSSVISITGPIIVKKDELITYTIKLSDIPAEVTAGKFIIQYPVEFFKYVDVQVVSSSAQIITSEENNGEVTVIATSLAGGFENNNNLLQISLIAKTDTGSSSVSVEAELGIGAAGEFVTEKADSITFRALPPTIEGDINGNQTIDIGDLAALAYYFNIDSAHTEWSYVISGDFNKNLRIDLEDLVFLSKKLMLDTEAFSIMEATVQSIHAAVKRGEITFVEVMQMYLDRIAAYDKAGPKINSIITVNKDALSQAAQMDAEFKATGKLKPLQGIPVIAKDNYDTIGMPTSAGCLCLADHYTATDAYMIEQLKEAGAIIIAKANLAEFAFNTNSTSGLGGATLNPYDPATHPGGSSGGTGAAIASNFGVIGLGTDTGGSIRIPSSFNSLVGIRTTIGLTSRSGIIPLALTQDVGGPMTRTVADAAIALDVLAGYDEKDIMTAWSVNRIPDSYTDYLDVNGLRGAKIGVLTNSQVQPSANVAGVFNQAKADLERLGATVVEVELPNLTEMLSYASLSGTEFKYHLNDYLKSHENTVKFKDLTDIVENGSAGSVVASSLAQRNNAPSLNDEKYKDILLFRTKLAQQAILKIMADYELDAIMYPATAGAAGGSGGNANRIGAFSGFPSIVLPAGYITNSTTTLSRPFGIELLARPFEEQVLIKLGYSYEQGTQNRIFPSTTPELVVE